MSFFPPLPKEPEERRAVMEIWKRERRLYRRRPSLIVGLVMAGGSGLALNFTLPYVSNHLVLLRLLLLIGIFGVCLVYDTVTAHFSIALRESERSKSARTKVEEP